MKRINNKMVLSLMLVFFIIFGYVAPIAPVFAEDAEVRIKYERGEGANLDTVATKIGPDTTIDGKYSAYSKRIKGDVMSVYNHVGTTSTSKITLNNDNTTPISYEGNQNNWYLKSNENYTELYYTIQLPAGDGIYQDIATVIYPKALIYGGKIYNVILNIKEIRKVGAAVSEFRILKGKKDEEAATEGDKFKEETYKADFNPSIAVGTADNVKTEVDVEYIIQDNRGIAHNISGIFGATDIDLNQGIYIANYQANSSNLYMNDTIAIDEDTGEKIDLKYTNPDNNGIFIYTNSASRSENMSAYLLMDNIYKVDLCATFETKGAVLGLTFLDNVMPKYYNLVINSEIDHGVIKTTDNDNIGTESTDVFTESNIEPGVNKTNKVKFKPATGYEVTNVIVDGVQVPLSDCTKDSSGVYTYTITDTDINDNIEHNVYVTTGLKDTSVLAKYIVVNDEGTKIKELLNIPYQGKVGDQYTTTQLTFDGYEFKEVTPANKVSGRMTENQIVVTYKYVLKNASVKVKYLEVGTDKVLAPQKTITKKIGDSYTTQAETIDGYKLLITPTNANGTLQAENVDVIYYYTKVTKNDATVIVNYLDEERNKIWGSDVQIGKVDDAYTSEQIDIRGYEIKTVPENASGHMTEEPTIVDYIYKLKPAQVVVKYVDTDGKEIAEGKTIDGKYFTPYETQSEDIDDYKLISVPDNATGTMEKDVTTVTYVYDLKEGNVVVNYLDEDGKKIVDSETQKGKVTEEYTTNQKTIDGYTIKTVPSNAKGVYTENEIVVNYIYSKNAPVDPEEKNEQKKTEDPTTYKGNGTVKELPNTGKYAMIIVISTILVIALYGVVMAIKTKKYKDIK